MLQENVDLYAKWIDKLGSGEVTEEGYEDTFEGYCQVKWNSRVLEAKPVVGRT